VADGAPRGMTPVAPASGTAPRPADQGQPRTPWAIGLSAVVPGLGSIAIGRRVVGAWILGSWVVAVATLAITRGDVSETLTTGGTGNWIALVTLLLTLVGVWVWGVLDVAVVATRPVKRLGVGPWRLAWRA
jgi:hypothetical protein